MRGRPRRIRTTIAAALLVAARASGDPAPTIELAVTGSIDAGIVATRVARELARPVLPLAAHERCHAPCLAVAVIGRAATITFTTTSGGTRQRTIELGADRAQWAEMLTLLAGNLVRDEALALLADPPPATPPPAPDVPVPPAPPAAPNLAPTARVAMPLAPPSAVRPGRPEKVAWLGFGLVPGASTDLLDLDRSHVISIGLVAGSSGEIHGLALSGVVDIARRVSGLQVSGAVAVAGDVTGAQLAGAAAVADRASGVQIAGGVAATGHLTGFQLAPINVARRNDGIQLGVIDIGGGPDGDSFGVLTIVPGGRTELETTFDSDQIATVMLRHGGRRWHNVYGVAGQSVHVPDGAPNDDVWMFGAGFGPSLHVAGLPVEIEAMTWQVNHDRRYDEKLSLLNQLRITVGVPLGPVTLVAGGAIDVYVSNDHASPFFTTRTTMDPTSTDVTVKLWPSLFVGARI